MNALLWSALFAVAAAVACWGLDRIVRKSEDDLIAEYLNSQRSAPPHGAAASEEVDKRWARQCEIIKMMTAVRELQHQASEKKFFGVVQQLEKAIVVLKRELYLCRQSPDAFATLTETWNGTRL